MQYAFYIFYFYFLKMTTVKQFCPSTFKALKSIFYFFIPHEFSTVHLSNLYFIGFNILVVGTAKTRIGGTHVEIALPIVY